MHIVSSNALYFILRAEFSFNLFLDPFICLLLPFPISQKLPSGTCKHDGQPPPDTTVPCRGPGQTPACAPLAKAVSLSYRDTAGGRTHSATHPATCVDRHTVQHTHMCGCTQRQRRECAQGVKGFKGCNETVTWQSP